MGKKIYSQKFELNKDCVFGLSFLTFFFALFLLLAGVKIGMPIVLCITVALLILVSIYIVLYGFLSVKKNKLIIFENHIEASVFKFLAVKNYNLKIDEIKKVYTSHHSGWSIFFELNNGKTIKFYWICLPIGKGTYYECKKLLNALKKVGL